MTDDHIQERTTRLAAGIVSVFASNNSFPKDEVPQLVASVHRTIKTLGTPAAKAKPPAPAVPVKKSITPSFIICLEDGQKVKLLRRHIQDHHSLTPNEYREKWNLPADYPMVAPRYAAVR